MRGFALALMLLSATAVTLSADDTRSTELYKRINANLNAVPAIDTHDHLPPFDQLPGYNETEYGKGMNLYGLWKNSYYTWYNPLTPWQPKMKFADWWEKA